jgi:frataxin-like iron-binding protein CyaY
MKYDGKDMMSFFRPNSSYNESRGFGIDNNNNIWCATYSGGLAKFNGSDFSIYNMSNSKIPSNYLQTLVVDEIGNVWIGSQFSGLVKFDGKNWTIYTSGNSGLQDNSIRSLAFDKFKNLWIGTQSGISVFKEGGVITSIHEYIETNIPKTFFLSQNYPNPFNPTTTIQYSIPTEGYVTLKVYDMIGREVKILVDEEKSPGKYEAIFNRASLPSGVYFYKLTACTFNQTKKMILLK